MIGGVARHEALLALTSNRLARINPAPAAEFDHPPGGLSDERLPRRSQPRCLPDITGAVVDKGEGPRRWRRQRKRLCVRLGVRVGGGHGNDDKPSRDSPHRMSGPFGADGRFG